MCAVSVYIPCIVSLRAHKAKRGGFFRLVVAYQLWKKITILQTLVQHKSKRTRAQQVCSVIICCLQMACEHLREEMAHAWSHWTCVLLKGAQTSGQWWGQTAPPTPIPLLPHHHQAQGHTSHVHWGHRNDSMHVGRKTRMEEQLEAERIVLLSEAPKSKRREQIL